jgi:hypothetical protein
MGRIYNFSNMLEITLYKLTDRDGYTRRGSSNEMKWEPGQTVEAQGTGGLCTDGVIHAYRDPLLAVLLNPVHADYKDPLLWEAAGANVIDEKADKLGVKSLRVIKHIPLPEITREARIRFAIACALEVYSEATFVQWACVWLSGKDRSAEAAEPAAARAARAAAAAAEEAAAWAARAAEAAAWSAAASEAAEAWAAWSAAAWAAWSAAAAAEAWSAAAEPPRWQRLAEIAQWAISRAELSN